MRGGVNVGERLSGGGVNAAEDVAGGGGLDLAAVVELTWGVEGGRHCLGGVGETIGLVRRSLVVCPWSDLRERGNVIRVGSQTLANRQPE